MKSPIQALLAPEFKTTPYWWEDAPPEEARDELPAEADVVIVGSGYCGLSAAVALARAGRQVAVLDKGPIGHGGSTRSGGMVSSGQKLVVTGAVKGMSPEFLSRLLAESLQSFEFMKRLIEDNELDADLQLRGRYFGAYTPSHFETLQRHGRLLREKTGVTVHTVARRDQRKIVGSDFYYGGIVVDEYGGLHVGKYHRSLRRLARQAGAGLYSHAGVLRLSPEGAGHVVHTERGSIRARDVIMATNGYTDDSAPYLHRRIVPVASYQIATAPLPPGLMDAINPGRRMISDSQRNLYYSRPSPDGTRILFGSRPYCRDVPEEQAANRLYRDMLRVYPELQGIPITHSWKGNVGMTLDKQGRLGRHDGIYHAVGCNGNGVALMTYLGYRCARGLLDGDLAQSAFAASALPSAFYYHGDPGWLVPAATAMYNLSDAWAGRERR
ncbi:FAD-dependent oxidoreductase [Bordetella genomosp. 10]|uniref:FAD-dependent oxidoreductase n=1 Tax=Bordetella genomosp. 10 TaxID=1416804 RepID=A0A261SMQ2_9BORD|nr:FAD-binding oxidoreductase [Bordetella genomosp. 10]OZI38267.1 FAD-dependent oxidoreductase [Bordetella genomosp. 10]